MIKDFTIGSDTEILLVDLTGKPFPVTGLVGGTKEAPRSLGDGFAIQEDNVALEFNIPICKSKKEFLDAMYKAFEKIQKELPPTVQLDWASSAKYDPCFLNAIPQLMEFGCEPDLNAYTRLINPRPVCDDPNFRTAAGHLHIGWPNPTDDQRFELVKLCDVFAGLPSVWMDEKGGERRKLYGKAGAMRRKSYGIEHRVLSNFWALDRPTAGKIYDYYELAINSFNAGVRLSDVDAGAVQEAINTSNSDLASKMHTLYMGKTKKKVAKTAYQSLEGLHA